MHHGERKVGRPEFEGEDDGVDIVKEMQVDVRHFARHRCGPFAEHQADRFNIGAPIDTQGRVAVAETAHGAWRIAVEKALHVRKEADEFAIVALLKVLALDAELIIDQRPRVAC